MGGHHSLTTLVAAYENCSGKWQTPVTDTFFTSYGCLIIILLLII